MPAPSFSWCRDEYGFYQWTAGVLGQYPISEEEFSAVTSLMPFDAFDEDGLVGFFTLRNPGELLDEVRFGFVIVDPAKRGRGYGKELLRFSVGKDRGGRCRTCADTAKEESIYL